MIGRPVNSDSMPAVHRDLARYVEGCAHGQMLVQHCGRCDKYIWPPRPYCKDCLGTPTDYHDLRGSGTVFSWTRIEQAAPLSHQQCTPYTVVVVELIRHPGVRFLGGLLDNPPLTRRLIGAAVDPVFTNTPRGELRPYWRLQQPIQ